MAWLAPVVILGMPPWSGLRAQQQPLPLQHVPQPTTAAISAADLMTRLYIFADDSMMGRWAGSAGDPEGHNLYSGRRLRGWASLAAGTAAPTFRGFLFIGVPH